MYMLGFFRVFFFFAGSLYLEPLCFLVMLLSASGSGYGIVWLIAGLRTLSLSSTNIWGVSYVKSMGRSLCYRQLTYNGSGAADSLQIPTMKTCPAQGQPRLLLPQLPPHARNSPLLWSAYQCRPSISTLPSLFACGVTQ